MRLEMTKMMDFNTQGSGGERLVFQDKDSGLMYSVVIPAVRLQMRSKQMYYVAIEQARLGAIREIQKQLDEVQRNRESLYASPGAYIFPPSLTVNSNKLPDDYSSPPSVEKMLEVKRRLEATPPKQEYTQRRIDADELDRLRKREEEQKFERQRAVLDELLRDTNTQGPSPTRAYDDRDIERQVRAATRASEHVKEQKPKVTVEDEIKRLTQSRRKIDL